MKTHLLGNPLHVSAFWIPAPCFHEDRFRGNDGRQVRG